MKSLAPSLRAVPAIATLAALAAATVAATGPTVVPDPTLEPAIVAGRDAGLVFAGHDGHGAIHVHAAVPVGSELRELGPRLRGDDGAPAVAELPGRGFIVVASRRNDAGSLVWSQHFDGSRWTDARVLPGMDRESHRPAIAAGGDGMWAVWVSGNGSGDPETLLAAPWTGETWGPAEVVPAAPGPPGAPAIAVGPDGLPAVVWAARDRGDDTEIWLARRGAAGWASPRRLTRNGVADVTPSAGFAGDTLLTAWSTFSADGYRVRAADVNNRGRIRRRPLSRAPGTAPRVVPGAAEAHVVWSTPWHENPSVSELRVSTWRGDRFGRGDAVARARNARVAVAGAGSGDWLAAWHDDSGIVAAAMTSRRGGAPQVRALLPDARRSSLSELELQLPGSYLAFGDSITAGVVRYNGIISFVEGYPVHLGRMISHLLGQNVIIAERAVPGEMTPEGYNRLRVVMISEPRKIVLLNEGANDVANLMDPSVVFQNLLAMTAAVRERDALPVLSTITPRNEASFGGGINARIDIVNEMILSHARSAALLVDMQSAFEGNVRAYSDHIHPDADGYVLMAEVWFRGLLPVLNSLVQAGDVQRALDDAAAQALKPGRLDRIQ